MSSRKGGPPTDAQRRWNSAFPPSRGIPREELQDGIPKSVRERLDYGRPPRPRPAYPVALNPEMAARESTQKPYHELRGQGIFVPPREGPGDYRGDEDGRHQQYVTRQRNGMPEFVPYVYGASRHTAAYRKLDLKAIGAADWVIDDLRRRKKGPRKRVNEDRILALRDELPDITQAEIAEIAGVSKATVSKVLRARPRKAKPPLEQFRPQQPAARPQQPGLKRMRPEDLARIRGSA